MKWSNLMKFCISMVMGLAGCTYPLGRPAWYSYGGIIAPAMASYDYPCAVMVCSDPSLYDGGNCTLYLFSGPPAVEEDSFKAWETDLNVMVWRVRGNVWKKESAFTLAMDTSIKAQYSNFIWSNFDLYTLDSQLVLSASEPLPTVDYVTTLFEGDVTTVEEDYIVTNPSTGAEYTYTPNGAHAVIADSAILDSYGLIRITVDEAPVGYKIRNLILGDYAGNYHLAYAEKEDTGGNFGVLSILLSGETLLLSREPGTYHVKVEKIERRAQVTEQWETLFEGQVTTAETNYLGSMAKLDLSTFPLFTAGQGIRLTIDGVHAVYTAFEDSDDLFCIGNIGLRQALNMGNDDGTDYLLQTSYYNSVFVEDATELWTRNPGTYTVKIERAL